MTDYADIGELSPLNNFDRTIKLEDPDSVTGTRTPYTRGVVTAFLSTSPAPDATPATTGDATLSVTAVHVGGNPTVAGGHEKYPPGTFLVHIASTALTVSLLTQLFANATPYLIVSMVGGPRKVGRLTYVAASSGGAEE